MESAKDGVIDLFFLGLKSFSIRKALNNLNVGITYKTDDDLMHVWKENTTLHFGFRYQHDPSNWYNFALDPVESEHVVKWLAYHSCKHPVFHAEIIP